MQRSDMICRRPVGVKGGSVSRPNPETDPSNILWRVFNLVSFLGFTSESLQFVGD